MNEINKKAAKFLIFCGHAKEAPEGTGEYGYVRVKDHRWPSKDNYRCVAANPFVNTLDSREQADAIENHLIYHAVFNDDGVLWQLSKDKVEHPNDRRQYRLNRIEWCLNELY